MLFVISSSTTLTPTGRMNSMAITASQMGRGQGQGQRTNLPVQPWNRCWTDEIPASQKVKADDSAQGLPSGAEIWTVGQRAICQLLHVFWKMSHELFLAIRENMPHIDILSDECQVRVTSSPWALSRQGCVREQAFGYVSVNRNPSKNPGGWAHKR